MHKRADVENLNENVDAGIKNYVRVAEAAELFSMGTQSVRSVAEEAGAIRRIRGIILINVKALSDYIEMVG